jgi:hypothetical protein
VVRKHLFDNIGNFWKFLLKDFGNFALLAVFNRLSLFHERSHRIEKKKINNSQGKDIGLDILNYLKIILTLWSNFSLSALSCSGLAKVLVPTLLVM